jgi:2-isopropylmalate synthase
VVSELAGVSNLVYKAKQFGLDIDNTNSPEMKELVRKLKELEHFGYQFEEAEASFEILMLKSLKKFKPIIELERFRLLDEKSGDKTMNLEATLKVKIGNKKVHIVAEGNGPVSALDHALRQALEKEYPEINQIKLTDYKVRVLNSKDGTNAVVRVLIQWQDNDAEWGTVGVSENILEASWAALVDSYEYKLNCKVKK